MSLGRKFIISVEIQMTRWQLGILIGLLSLLASANQASASMLISPSETLTLSSNNGMSNSTPTQEKQQPVQPDQLQEQLAVPVDGSSMTSSSSGAAGTSVSQAIPVSLEVFQQDSLTSRLASDAKLILPSPFILDLKRPPQILS